MRQLSLLLAAGLLSACASGAPRTIADQNVTYTYGDFFRVADGRDTRVIVRGNPFALTQAEFDTFVTTNMATMSRGPRTNFTTAKSANADPDYEVVWLFNGARTTQPEQLCRSPQDAVGVPGPADRLRVVAAYCRYDRVNTWVEGWIEGGPQGVPREGVMTLVQQMTQELFPTVNRNDPAIERCSGPLC
ncbi:MAG: hypothetical protein ACK4NA_05265 [Alphaproteobacteria bacterium]